MKEFRELKILNAKDYIEKLGKHCDDFKFKQLNKKVNEDIFVLSKKGFKKLQDECETEFRIEGRIRKRQRKYEEKDYEDKQAENIIGKVTLESEKNAHVFHYDDDTTSYHEELNKFYDLRENKSTHVWGYAYVGNDTFVKVTKFNPLWILIPLLCILGILFGMHFCQNNGITPFNIVDGEDANKVFDVTKTSNVTIFNHSGDKLTYTINAVAKQNIENSITIKDVIQSGEYKYAKDLKVMLNKRDITKSCVIEYNENGFDITVNDKDSENKIAIKEKDKIVITYSGNAFKTDPIINEVRFKTRGYSPSKATCTVAPPNVTYEPFAQVLKLTKNDKNITLANDSDNEGNYYISYAISIDGKAVKGADGNQYTTGQLPPDREININLYDKLDKGTYELTALATCYDYSILKELQDNGGNYSAKEYQKLLDEAKKPVTHTLKTTLKVEK